MHRDFKHPKHDVENVGSTVAVARPQAFLSGNEIDHRPSLSHRVQIAYRI